MSLCLGLTIGLAAAQHANQPKQLRFSLLVFESCPNSPAMKANLGSALKALHLKREVTVIDIMKLPSGDRRRDYGAPTVLVDGKDLFGKQPPASRQGGISCRIYPNGVPSAMEIQKRLQVRIFEKVHGSKAH